MTSRTVARTVGVAVGIVLGWLTIALVATL